MDPLITELNRLRTRLRAFMLANRCPKGLIDQVIEEPERTADLVEQWDREIREEQANDSPM